MINLNKNMRGTKRFCKHIYLDKLNPAIEIHQLLEDMV
tara:strand:- start:327 stop:440 length:114 start_codon:yes stop_codon:yes gene_type:complete